MSSKSFHEVTALSVNDRLRDIELHNPVAAPVEPEEILSFSHYIWLIRKNWVKVATAVAVFTGLVTIVTLTLTPQYESTARIAIDPKTPSTMLGQTPTPGSPSDTEQMFNTEMQLIQSDGVVRPVAEEYHLMAKPKANRKLPDGMKASDAPVSLKGLTVTHPANSLLIDITYRCPDPKLAADVANAVAQSYLAHGMELRVRSAMEQSTFMEKQISSLKKNMEDSQRALAGYEKKLGVIDSDQKTSMLAARVLQLNTQYTDAQNDRIAKETDYNALKTGSTAAIEVSPQAAALVKLEDALHAAQEKMAQAKTIYGSNNLEYKRAANELDEVTQQYNAMKASIGNRIEVQFQEAKDREEMLGAALAQAKAQADSLNASSLQYQQLKRDAEANKTLYEELSRKVKEAAINGGFQSDTIRIFDEARPQLNPVFPNKTIFIALSLMFSFAGSVIVLILLDMSDKTLRDPKQASRAIGVDVIGILPSVQRFQALSTTAEKSLLTGTALRKAQTQWMATGDFYKEAISTLLSTIFLQRRSYPLRSILVTSAAPGEGKSSCAAHMAAAHARKGFRTLLIDADLRRPSQQRFFDLPESAGLAEAIAEHRSLSEVRQTVPGNEKLDVIMAGNGSPSLLDSVGMKVEQFLVQARKDYDVVLIDAPPMLCFAEPLQIACVVDGVVVVSLAGQTSEQAVTGVLSVLRRLRANTLGVVLNQVKDSMSPSYANYQSYYRKIDAAALKSA